MERRLEESNYSLVFVTERIQGSVDFLLSKRDVETDSSSGLFDVELRYGLLQICEGNVMVLRFKNIKMIFPYKLYDVLIFLLVSF